MSADLHLLIPGLRGPLPSEAATDQILQPRLPVLERVFAQARTLPLPRRDLFAQLRALFQLAGDELPAGALGWLGEGEDPGQAHWLRADPVHLQPDRDQLMLFDAAAFAVDASEATALVAECNRLLREDALILFAPAPNRWYLRSESPLRLRTTPATAISGRYVGDHMPRGADAGRWLGLMTELQMLLHQAPTNRRRDDAGALTINGVWLWGAGRLPDSAGGGWQHVVADEPVARGLAHVIGVAPTALPEHAAALPLQGRCLVLVTALSDALRAGDPGRWRRELDMLEQRWLAPLVGRLRAGRLATLTIHTDASRLVLRRRDRYRFWRRPQPLRHHLEF